MKNKKITSVELKDEFKMCPTCGYSAGFHTMLKKYPNSIKWLFICPSCHTIFDLGYTIDIPEKSE